MIDDLMAQMDGFVTQKDIAKFIKKYKSVDYLGMPGFESVQCANYNIFLFDKTLHYKY